MLNIKVELKLSILCSTQMQYKYDQLAHAYKYPLLFPLVVPKLCTLATKRWHQNLSGMKLCICGNKVSYFIIDPGPV